MVESSLSSKPLVILGMFRSGTSCVATCFKELGFYFGDDSDLFPADSFNQGGYHEIKELMNLNRKALGALGMQHFRIEEIPSDWAELPGMTAYLEGIRNLLESKLGGHPKWGWKEPQTSVLMPLYRQIFSELGLDPTYVICVRNPLAVSASQRSHSPLPHIGERVVGLWLHYTLSALRETKGCRRIVFHYESFVEDPMPFLSAAIELVPDNNGLSELIGAATSKVNPEWRHNRPDETGLQDWPELVRDVYRLAKDCSIEPTRFLNGEFDEDVEQLWKRWRQMREMVRASAMPNGQIISSWLEQGRTRSRIEPMMPTGSWQKITIPIEAPPGSIVHLDPYQTPCLFWIRNATLKGYRDLPADLRPGRTGMLSLVGGIKRLVIWGPDPMLLQLPREACSELHLEVLVQANPNALNEVIAVMKGNVEFLIQKLNQSKPK